MLSASRCLVPIVAAGAVVLAQGPGAAPTIEPEALQSLPLPFDFWAAFQILSPSAVTEPLRLGGFSAVELPPASREAGSWVQTTYTFNGIPSWDPYQPGRPIFLPDYQSVEITLPSRVEEPRLTMSIRPGIQAATRPAGAQWRTTIATFLTASALASDNRGGSEVRAGLLQPEQYRWYTLNRLSIGGPVHRRANLSLALAGRWAEQSLPREPPGEQLGARILIATARANLLPRRYGRFAIGFAGSYLHRSGFGWPAGFEALAWRRGAPPFRPAKQLPEDDSFRTFNIAWAPQTTGRPPLDRWEIRYGYITSRLETPPSPARGLPRIELLDGGTAGPPPLADSGFRERHYAAFTWSSQPWPTRGAPQLSAGFSWGRTASRNRWTGPGDTHQIFVAGQPASVVFWNTPLDSKARGQSVAAYVAGSIHLFPPLTLYSGLRFDHRRAGLPAQTSPGGVHWPGRSFPDAGTLIRWTTLSPRVALSLTLPGRWMETVRASYMRFPEPLALRYADYANPNSLSGLEHRWRDANGDGVWQPSETGILLRRFGGLYSGIDAALQSPYTGEFRVSLASNLPRPIRALVEGYRRDYRRRLAARNTGVPFTLPSGAPSYRLVRIIDPGPDSSPGTFDDQSLTVYEQTPATFGHDRFLLTNTEADAFSTGITAQLEAAGDSYWWRLSFVAEKGYGTAAFGNDPWENDPGVPGSLYQDPNGLLNATGRFFFDRAYSARFLGAWRTPRRFGGFEIAVAAAYWDGLPFARKLLVEGLAQGPVVIMATPRGSPEGGHRTEFNLSIDLRVAREFTAGPGKLRIVADIFNLPNLGLHLRERDLTAPEFNSRLPVAIQPPRFLRIGCEYRF